MVEKSFQDSTAEFKKKARLSLLQVRDCHLPHLRLLLLSTTKLFATRLLTSHNCWAPSLVSEDNGLAALDHKVAYQSSYQCIQCQLLIQLGTNVLPRTCFHCRILKKCRSIHEQLSFFADAFPIGLKVYCIIPTSWVQTSSKSRPVDRHSSMGLSSLNGLKSSACEKFDWLIVSLVNQPIKRWISETRTFSATCFALKGEVGGNSHGWHGKNMENSSVWYIFQ